MTPNQIGPTPSFLLPLVQTCSLKRFKLAVDALSEETPPVVLTHVSDAAVRALVASGDKEYGVTLTASLSTCSCKDYSYRGEVCKHQILTALHAIRTPSPQLEVEAPPLPVPVDVAPTARTVPEGVVSPVNHLSWRDSLVCCGIVSPPKSLMYPWPSTVLNAPDTCRDCVAIHAAGYNSHMLHLTKTRTAA